MRILLVEDDRKAARLLARGLEEERFVVDVASTGAAGDEMAGVNDYDVIVLDWLLPDKEGIDVCRDLRSRGVSTPILMLTARDSLEDRVIGLNTGADDYLVKPFGFAELLARIHALLRRSDITRPVVLKVADLTLDPSSHRVERGGLRINLTPKEYAILEMLMRRAGQVVTRASLSERVWETEHDGFTNLVDVHVSHLRRKVDTAGASPLIHTVRGTRLSPRRRRMTVHLNLKAQGAPLARGDRRPHSRRRGDGRGSRLLAHGAGTVRPGAPGSRPDRGRRRPGSPDGSAPRSTRRAPGTAPPSFPRLDKFIQIVDDTGAVVARSANLGTARLPTSPALLATPSDQRAGVRDASRFRRRAGATPVLPTRGRRRQIRDPGRRVPR